MFSLRFVEGFKYADGGGGGEGSKSARTPGFLVNKSHSCRGAFSTWDVYLKQGARDFTVCMASCLPSQSAYKHEQEFREQTENLLPFSYENHPWDGSRDSEP